MASGGHYDEDEFQHLAGQLSDASDDEPGFERTAVNGFLLRFVYSTQMVETNLISRDEFKQYTGELNKPVER